MLSFASRRRSASGVVDYGVSGSVRSRRAEQPFQINPFDPRSRHRCMSNTGTKRTSLRLEAVRPAGEARIEHDGVSGRHYLMRM
jgi:hypothetical protein